MARQEHPKEDLLRDATALVERIELKLEAVAGPEFPDSILIGFRVDGAASLFWGQDEVYHLTAANQLRRGFFGDRLLKAESHQLFWLYRERSASEVVLRRRPLSDIEACVVLTRFRDRTELLLSSLRDGSRGFEVIGHVAPHQNADMTERCVRWLESLTHPVSIAGRPNVSPA